MTDDLRTRIATAICGLDDWRGITDPTMLADAVIRELSLTQEWSIGDDDGRVIWDDRQEAIDYKWRNDQPVQTRHVTEWAAVDEHGELTDSGGAE